MIGGPGTPGVLIAKKVLFNRDLPPVNAGGGTIDFVRCIEKLSLYYIEH